MKNKRFISVDESGESIFTFDEADMIIDTKTNIIYGANNIPDLVKILNSQSLQWQKLKEWLNKEADHVRYTPYDCRSLSSDFELWHLNKILEKMQELVVEDE